MDVARMVMRRDAGLLNELAYNGAPETNTTATYKYRNVEQRRAYMRDLMRKRREKHSV